MSFPEAIEHVGIEWVDVVVSSPLVGELRVGLLLEKEFNPQNALKLSHESLLGKTVTIHSTFSLVQYLEGRSPLATQEITIPVEVEIFENLGSCDGRSTREVRGWQRQ